MKTVFTSILKYVFVGALFICLYLLLFPSEKEVITNEISVIDTVYVDNVHVEIDTLKVYYPVDRPIDTALILKDYFSIKQAETNYKDEHISIKIKDSIYKNNVENRTLEYSILPRADPTKLFLGLNIYSNNQQLGLLLNLSLVKNRSLYSLGYDPINKSWMLGYHYQLKIKTPGRKRRLKLLK